MWSVCLSFPLCSKQAITSKIVRSKGEVRGEIEFDHMPCETSERWSTFPAFWAGFDIRGAVARGRCRVRGKDGDGFGLGEELV